MLERILRLAAIACSLLVAVGWLWFAGNETSAASKGTQEELAGQRASRIPDPTPEDELVRAKANSRVHEYVDDANDLLLRPFAPLVASADSKWARRTVPAALALLVYGFGLGLLARFAAGR